MAQKLGRDAIEELVLDEGGGRGAIGGGVDQFARGGENVHRNADDAGEAAGDVHFHDLARIAHEKYDTRSARDP